MQPLSDSMQTDPSRKEMTLRYRVRSISVTASLPCVKIACGLLSYPTPTRILFSWIFYSCKSFWMLPIICMYCCSNYCNTSVIVSVIMSSIKSRSPSVSNMGSIWLCLSDLFFFCCPPVYSFVCLFRMKGVLFSSVSPPPYSNSSCSSV